MRLFVWKEDEANNLFTINSTVIASEENWSFLVVFHDAIKISI